MNDIFGLFGAAAGVLVSWCEVVVLAGDWCWRCFVLFSFDVEQMAATAQEKTPAGLTTTNSLLTWKACLSLELFFFPSCFVSWGCFWGYCAVQSFALNLKYWKEIKSDGGIIVRVLDMLSCLMKIWSSFCNVIVIFCLNFVLVWCSEIPVAFS